jgi:uncharacterized protein (TIGR02145 family)
MKTIVTIILAFFLTGNIVKAQHSLYKYKSKEIINKRVVYAIDSIIFNQAGLSSFTCGTSTITDIDGNTYNTISIGSQCWMRANLKTTKYLDNTAIQNVTSNTEWSTLTTGAYCNYKNTPSNGTTYGKLYNWYAVTSKHNICPTGWHVPSNAEWNILENYLDNTIDTTAIGWAGTDIGGKLKETGTTHWNSPNTSATNSSGFSALPGGTRFDDGSFNFIGNFGLFWTATAYNTGTAWERFLGYRDSQISPSSSIKTGGFSIRCVRD